MTKSNSHAVQLDKGRLPSFRSLRGSSFYDQRRGTEDVPGQNSARKSLVAIPESTQSEASRKRGAIDRLPDYVWYFVMIHLDLPFILTRLMCVSAEKRQFFSSINSALFDVFLRGYGLCQKLRRSDLPGKIQLIPFLTKLERNMVRA